MKRRTFITGAFIGTAALALGVNLYSESTLSSQAKDGQRVLFSILIPVFLDGALPAVASQKELAINSTVDAIEQAIAVLPEQQQIELAELFELLESRLGLLILTGSVTSLMLRDSAELTRILEHWRFHFLEMVQTAYTGLRELVLTSYYSNPEHWGRLGYAKPTFLLNEA
ncbi:TAT leader-containing periplasmic protein [Shewanella gaetbuli]|uniref:TAT leader-containing periplasmic protein n=1 Tax=Shewanella gaetbuli TaxID=220752 RepID=A0A9X1ZH85_9GAMM|nr:TAT leader-containing periplasmic protein [Shewanella gaetbuli]MCL1142269.1 TAT leader-containing periplasmic protein [Shewanella gaetbuli]